MVLGQAQEARRICQSLRHEETDCVAELVLLGRGPAIGILKEGGERGFLEGFLKIFVSPDEFVENLDIRLYVLDLCRILDVEDGEGRDRGAVVDVRATWLEEATDKDDFEEVDCILEELEGAACLDELCGVGVKVGFLDCFEVLVELVSEHWGELAGRWHDEEGGIPAGSCFAWALTAPFRAFILTPCSEGFEVVDC